MVPKQRPLIPTAVFTTGLKALVLNQVPNSAREKNNEFVSFPRYIEMKITHRSKQIECWFWHLFICSHLLSWTKSLVTKGIKFGTNGIKLEPN